MKIIITVSSLIVVKACGIWQFLKRRQPKRESAELFSEHLDDFKSAISDFESKLQYENEYFSQIQLNCWKQKYFSTYESARKLFFYSPLLTNE